MTKLACCFSAGLVGYEGIFMGYRFRFWRRIAELVFLSCFGVGLWGSGVYAQTSLGVNVRWKPNTNNSPSQLGGYHIYYGPSPGVYTNVVTVGPTDTKARVEPLVPNAEYYMVLTAFNPNGLESLPTDPPLHYKAPLVPTNTAPLISLIPNQTLIEDRETRAINFTVSDAESPPNMLTVLARSSNRRLIPEPYILLGGSGNQRTMMIVPQLDQWGTADITLEVRDPQGGSNSMTFTVTVSPVNDDPVISYIPSQIVNEDSGVIKVPFYVFDAESPSEALSLWIFSSDPELLPADNITLTGTGHSRLLTFTPLKDAFGSTIIDLAIEDEHGGQAWSSFAVLVFPVNDPPTLQPIPSFSVDEGSEAVSVMLKGITAGPPNEQQPLVVSAVSSDPRIIPDPLVNYVSPSNSASLVIAPRPGLSGTAEITVIVGDGQAVNAITNQSFTVTVQPLNIGPVILGLPDRQLNVRIPLPLAVSFTVIDLDTPSEGLTVKGKSSNPNLLSITDQDFSGTGALRTLTLKPIATGSVTVTIFVSDGESTISSSFEVLITSAAS